MAKKVSKSAAKRAVAKASPAAKKTSPLSKKAGVASKVGGFGGVVSGLQSPAAGILGGFGGKARAGRAGGTYRKRVSAKIRLKKAYERRAIYLIRTNQLGRARRALRQRAMVI